MVTFCSINYSAQFINFVVFLLFADIIIHGYKCVLYLFVCNEVMLILGVSLHSLCQLRQAPPLMTLTKV